MFGDEYLSKLFLINGHFFDDFFYFLLRKIGFSEWEKILYLHKTGREKEKKRNY
jgi:hypothetical protein